MKRMGRLLWNEMTILGRDSSVLFWIFLFPFFFMFMMLYAFGTSGSLPQQTIEVLDLDNSELSQRYIEEIRHGFSGTQSIPGELRSVDGDEPVGKGATRITLPEGFGESLEYGYPMVVPVTFAESGLSAQLVVRVLEALSLRFEADLATGPDLITVRGDPRGAVPSVQFVHYVLTGVMVMAMMSAGMTSVCIALAYRRERNGFKMLACMPLSAPVFLLAMLLARLLLLAFAAGVLVLCAQYLFGVPLVLTLDRVLKATLVLLLGGAMLLSLGTALGARIGNMSGANFITGLVYIALLFLCDLTMPMSAMPPDVRAVMAHLPPSLFVHVLRQAFILDGGLGQQLVPLAEMVGWLFAFSLIAVFTFRWHKQ